MIKTHVKVIDEKVLVNGTKLEHFNCETVRLSRQLGFELTIKELSNIPYLIQMTEKIKDGSEEYEMMRDHTPTIVGFGEDYVEVAVIIMGPTEHFKFECAEDDYLMAMKQAVREDKFLELSPEYEEDPEFDIDLYCQIVNIGAGYSHIGPFEFYVALAGPTYGDIALQLDSLSDELEEKAINIMKNKGRPNL